MAAMLGCGSSDDARVEPTPSGWDPTALAAAARLADAVRAAGLPCDGYEVWDHAAITTDYAQKMPVPAAMARCSGPDGEDLTFEIFADAKARGDFMATKMYLLCTKAREKRFAFPGLPYVEGDVWLVEPDEHATAERLAPILAGTAKHDVCEPAS